MKRTTFPHTTTLTVLAFFALAVCQAWASSPLTQPMGLALDANGNLYVANLGGNQSRGSILVYSPKFVLQAKKTITTAVDKPTGVGIDSQGNIYVANSLSGIITKYDSKGNWNSGATISQNIAQPAGVVVDSLDDVWVNNGLQYITIYSPFGEYLGSSTPGGEIDSIATGAEWYVVGGDSTWTQLPAGEVLTNNGIAGESQFPSHEQAVAATFNKAGNYFMAQETGEVDLINPLTTARTFVLSVAYPPTGMVVDSNRGHIFLSNRYNNTIDVFTTKGVHITTIQ
jgi:DNA-binding beta-propeller fold protein YncE